MVYAGKQNKKDQVGRPAPRLFEVGVVPQCHVTMSRGLPRTCDSPEHTTIARQRRLETIFQPPLIARDIAVLTIIDDYGNLVML